MRDGTAEGLIAFLNWMTAKGLVKTTTGNSYKSAVIKVFEIDGDGWEAIDVRGLDVAEQLLRFENTSGHNYTPSSLTTYRSRFERALEQYLAYLESPSSFKPSVSSRRRTRQQDDDDPSESSAGPADAGAQVEAPRPPERSSADLIEHTFPLRSGETAYFRLPREFSSSEVERMGGFLRALAFDPEDDQ